jgi:hypothetical protein
MYTVASEAGIAIEAVLRQRLRGRAHRLDNTFNGVLSHVQGELAGFDLGDVEHGIDEAQQVLAGADSGECIQRLLRQRAVKALLDEFGIAEDGGERGPKLVACPTVLLKPEAGQALAMVFHELRVTVL